MRLFAVYLPSRHEWVMSRHIHILIFLALQAGLQGEIEIVVVTNAGRMTEQRNNYYAWTRSQKIESIPYHSLSIDATHARLDSHLWSIKRPVRRPSDVIKVVR